VTENIKSKSLNIWNAGKTTSTSELVMYHRHHELSSKVVSTWVYYE